jgi:hypothetical protein
VAQAPPSITAIVSWVIGISSLTHPVAADEQPARQPLLRRMEPVARRALGDCVMNAAREVEQPAEVIVWRASR